MMYQQKTFTVAPSGDWDKARMTCADVGHMQRDRKGKCLRCAEVVPFTADDEPSDWTLQTK